MLAIHLSELKSLRDHRQRLNKVFSFRKRIGVWNLGKHDRHKKEDLNLFIATFLDHIQSSWLLSRYITYYLNQHRNNLTERLGQQILGCRL